MEARHWRQVPQQKRKKRHVGEQNTLLVTDWGYRFYGNFSFSCAMADILQTLSKNISDFKTPDIEDTGVRQQDILSSSLQKSLRRAHPACAHTAAKGLIGIDPRYFWRRLVTIAFEDFGLSDLSLTAEIVAAARNRAWRKAAGGDLRVAAYLIERLGCTPSDRRVDDLYMLAAAASRYEEYSACTQSASGPVRRLVEQAIALSKTCERPVPQRSFKAVVAKACDEAIMASGEPELAGLCIDGRKVSQCLLPVLLPALLQETWANHQHPYELRTEMLDDQPAGGVLLAALDGYTAIGRAILFALLRENKALSRLVGHATWISPVRAAAAILFCVEGGRLRNWLSDPLGEELGRVSLGCLSGLPRPLLPSAFDLMRELIPSINARRAAFLRGCTIPHIPPQEN